MYYSEEIREEDVPKDMWAQVEDTRQELVEHLSNVDDTLGEIFLGSLFVFVLTSYINKRTLLD